jgi:ABC-type sugar transport system substrate-binding protein
MDMNTNKKNGGRINRLATYCRLTCLFVCATACVLLAGCDDDDPTPAPANLIGLSLPNNPNSYMSTLVAGLESSLKSEGYTLVVTNAEGKTDDRLVQLNALLGVGVKAVALVSPGNELAESMAAIRARAVPVISLLESTPLANTSIVTDNQSEGATAAEAVNQLLPNGGKYQIMFLAGDMTETERTARINGLTGGLMASITQLAAPRSCVNSEAALSNAKNILTRDVQLCIAMDDESLQGFVRALDESAKTAADVRIIAFSGSPESKRLLKEGKIAAVIARSPLSAAASASHACNELLKGQPVDVQLLLQSTLITSENIGQHDADTWE